MNNITLIAQCDDDVGFGHIKRAFHVYKKIKKHFNLSFFLTKRNKTFYFFFKNKKKIVKNSFFVKKIIKSDLIIIDDLNLPKKNFEILKNKKILSLSPKSKLNSYADIIFGRCDPVGNYNKKSKIYSDYKYFISGTRSRSKFNFNFYKKNLFKTIKIGIQMSGYDRDNLMLKILSFIKKLNKNFLFFISLSNKSILNQIKIKNFLDKKNFNYTIVPKNKNWSYFKKCNLLILAGGISVFEAIKFGIPSINVVNKKWKLKILEGLITKKITTVFFKDNLDQMNYFLKNITKKKLIINAEKLKKYNIIYPSNNSINELIKIIKNNI